jgi:imidazolonepropionase-like amidohydrolase
MNSRLVFFAGVALAALPAVAAAQPQPGREGVFLIRGASVWTGTGAMQQNTNVLIRDGKIEAVGPNVTASGATEIDARGKFVFPGMTDAYTPLGLTEVGGIATMSLRSELGEFNPHMRPVVAINVDSELLGVTRANGVTSALTVPSGGIISGQAALINTAGWTWEDMAVQPSAAYVINYPRAGGGGGFGGGGGPGPGPGPGPGGGGPAAAQARERVERQIRELRQVLTLARAYDRQRAANAGKLDLVYEAMRPLVRGEVPALIQADTDEQIRTAIEFADSMGLKLVIYGGRDAWKVRELLAQKNIPVVLGSIQSTPSADAPYDAIYAQPGVLHEAGVKFAFSTGGGANARHVPYHAALAVAYGLPADAALKALTIWPAEIFGAQNSIGTIEPGKIANLFITSGDPLDVRSIVSDVFVKGRRVPMDDRHNRLYQKYNSRPGGRDF